MEHHVVLESIDSRPGLIVLGQRSIPPSEAYVLPGLKIDEAQGIPRRIGGVPSAKTKTDVAPKAKPPFFRHLPFVAHTHDGVPPALTTLKALRENIKGTSDVNLCCFILPGIQPAKSLDAGHKVFPVSQPVPPDREFARLVPSPPAP